MVHVGTKKELQEAIKRKESNIIVTGKLAKQMKGIAKVAKLTPKQKAALITFITGSGAAMVAAIAAAGPTMGLSLPAVGISFVVAAPAAGVSTEVAIAVAIIIGVVGLSAIALFRDYDVKVIYANGHIEFEAKKK